MHQIEAEHALSEPVKALARAYLVGLKSTAILREIVRQIEILDNGGRLDPENLAGIRGGIDDIQKDNEELLAWLAMAGEAEGLVPPSARPLKA